MLIALALSVQDVPVAVVNSPSPVVIVPVPAFPKSAPAPLPSGVRIVRGPMARAKLQDLVSQLDYPASALAAREEGRVGIVLEVGENGRVTACSVRKSSGSRALDATSCRILRARARFTPAIDNNGMPRAGRVQEVLEWRLPDAAGAERGVSAGRYWFGGLAPSAQLRTGLSSS